MNSLPNLASRPFINRRPVQRVAWLLWLVGGVALVANGFLYWRYVTGAGRRHDELTQIAADAERERAALAEQEEVLAGIDVEWQNDQVRFLNYKIAERTFSWSELFDQLADVLPRGVRLSRLQPNVARAETALRQAPATYGARVGLAMSGGAQAGEELYAFLDALFEHPAFAQPSLARETRDEAEVEFNLTVTYLPGEALPTGGPGETPSVEPPVEGVEAAAQVEADTETETPPPAAQAVTGAEEGPAS